MKNEGKKLLNKLVIKPNLHSRTIFKNHKNTIEYKNKLQKQYILPNIKIILRRGDY